MFTPAACLVALLAVPLHGRDSLPQGPAGGPQPTVLGPRSAGAASVKPGVGIRAALAQIVAAESELHGSTGRYGDLAELIQADLLRADSIGEVVGDGVFARDDYLIKVLVPTSDAGRREFFAAIAWPAGKRTGTVVASTPSEPIMINEAIAASLGIRIATTPDLYLSGEFGTTLVPGWHAAEETARGSTPTDDRALFETILAAEKQGDVSVPREVIVAMQAVNPTVAARAAYALGKLMVVAAVPELCDAVATHPDAAVNRQAMAALKNIGDARSLQTSVDALTSDDALLRALAAANIGQLKDESAAPALLSVVASGDGGSELRDRVAAILALTDIGAHNTLLSVAAAVTTNKQQLVEALTYMFQSLSPKLDQASETKVLIAVVGHPSPPLRLYAAQRLGQLRAIAAVQPLRDRAAAESDPKVKHALELSLRAIDSAPASARAVASEATSPSLWSSLSPTQRGLVSGGGVGVIVILGGLAFWRGRRRHADDADEMAAQKGRAQDQLSEAYTAYDDEQDAYDDDGQDAYDDEQGQQAAADAREAEAFQQHGGVADSGVWDATVDVGEDYEAAIEEE